jgi:hypothetical protein
MSRPRPNPHVLRSSKRAGQDLVQKISIEWVAETELVNQNLGARSMGDALSGKAACDRLFFSMRKPALVFSFWMLSSVAICSDEARRSPAEMRRLSYPPSELFAGLEWTSEPHRYPGIESDMHWQTWGADDAVYSVDGDGGFFGAEHYYFSLSRIAGTPPNHLIELITQFKELRVRENAPAGMQRYLCGPLAVGTNLYVCLYDYDWRIAGMDVSKQEEMKAVDRYSKHGGIPAIILSRDGGKTWSNAPTKETPRFLGPNFGNLQFIGFGPGYTRVPAELGDYVYAVERFQLGEWRPSVFGTGAARKGFGTIVLGVLLGRCSGSHVVERGVGREASFLGPGSRGTFRYDI